MRQVSFYYDVVCPYSYLETHAVEEAADAGAIEVTWLPFELRPAPRPLLDPRGDHLRVDWTRNVYRRALGLGIEIHLPRYQPRSTLPLAACLWATEQGALRAFKGALYEAFFCEGEDMRARCRSRARRAARASTRAPRSRRRTGAHWIARLAEIRASAEAAGVAGVPSLVAGSSSTGGRAAWSACSAATR